MNKLIITLFCSIFAVCVFFSCKSDTHTEEEIKAAGMYTYGDGSGNMYTITLDSIGYNPVNVVLKSGKDYDKNGKPAKKGLTNSEYKMINKLFNKALADTGNHADKRSKKSGVIALFLPGQPRKKCILAPGSGPQIEIEDALKKLLAKE